MDSFLFSRVSCISREKFFISISSLTLKNSIGDNPFFQRHPRSILKLLTFLIPIHWFICSSLTLKNLFSVASCSPLLSSVVKFLSFISFRVFREFRGKKALIRIISLISVISGFFSLFVCFVNFAGKKL